MRIREKKYYMKMPMTTSSYIGGRANLYGIVARSVIHSSTTRLSAIVPGGLPPPPGCPVLHRLFDSCL
jgi:hypothetical protein